MDINYIILQRLQNFFENGMAGWLFYMLPPNDGYLYRIECISVEVKGENIWSLQAKNNG